MEIARKTAGKITVIVLADKVGDYYINSSGDIKTVDNDYLNREIFLLKEVKKTGVFTMKMKAITKAVRDNIIKQDNGWRYEIEADCER